MATNVYPSPRRHYSRSAGKAAAYTYLLERQLRKVGETEFVDTLHKQAYPPKGRELLMGPLGKPLVVFSPGTL